MSVNKRFKFPKTVVFSISLLYVVLIVATYLVYYKGATEVCARRMLGAQVIALLFQIVLNYVHYRSEQKIIVLATLFISATIMLGAISSFFNLPLLCSIYSY